MKDQIHGTIKEERSKALIELNEKNEEEFMKKMVGKTVDVLFEEVVHGEEKIYTGYTPNYIKTICEGTEDLIGQIKKVYIKEVSKDNLIGEVL